MAYSKGCFLCYNGSTDGALAEKLGNGLQNRVDGSVTRRCLQYNPPKRGFIFLSVRQAQEMILAKNAYDLKRYEIQQMGYRVGICFSQ